MNPVVVAVCQGAREDRLGIRVESEPTIHICSLLSVPWNGTLSSSELSASDLCAFWHARACEDAGIIAELGESVLERSGFCAASGGLCAAAGSRGFPQAWHLGLALATCFAAPMSDACDVHLQA